MRGGKAAQLLVDLTDRFVDECAWTKNNLRRFRRRQPGAWSRLPTWRRCAVRRITGEAALKAEDATKIFAKRDPHRRLAHNDVDGIVSKALVQQLGRRVAGR